MDRSYPHANPSRATDDARTHAEPNRSLTSLRTVMQGMRHAQGRARQFWDVFHRSRVPMVTVGNHREFLAANAPARLLFRLSLRQMLERRIDHLTPPRAKSTVGERWTKLMRDGAVAGPYDLGFPDGSKLKVVYCALANALPGQHLIVFAPADWPGDELAGVDIEPDETPRRLLSRREREILGLIASGADQTQIAQELTIAVATVRTHVRNLLRKLGARNRAHAIALAMQYGLIDLRTGSAEDEHSRTSSLG